MEFELGLKGPFLFEISSNAHVEQWFGKKKDITSLLIMKWSTNIPSVQVWHLTKPLSGFDASLLQGTQPLISAKKGDKF